MDATKVTLCKVNKADRVAYSLCSIKWDYKLKGNYISPSYIIHVAENVTAKVDYVAFIVMGPWLTRE